MGQLVAQAVDKGVEPSAECAKDLLKENGVGGGGDDGVPAKWTTGDNAMVRDYISHISKQPGRKARQRATTGNATSGSATHTRGDVVRQLRNHHARGGPPAQEAAGSGAKLITMRLAT